MNLREVCIVVCESPFHRLNLLGGFKNHAHQTSIASVVIDIEPEIVYKEHERLQPIQVPR